MTRDFEFQRDRQPARICLLPFHDDERRMDGNARLGRLDLLSLTHRRGWRVKKSDKTKK